MLWTWNCTHTELHPSFKKFIKSLCMHKTKLFSYNLPFVIWFIPLVDIIGIKPAPGDHESNFMKVGAIPCGCNTKWSNMVGENIIGVPFVIFAIAIMDFSLLLPNTYSSLFVFLMTSFLHCSQYSYRSSNYCSIIYLISIALAHIYTG